MESWTSFSQIFRLYNIHTFRAPNPQDPNLFSCPDPPKKLQIRLGKLQKSYFLNSPLWLFPLWQPHTTPPLLGDCQLKKNFFAASPSEAKSLESRMYFFLTIFENIFIMYYFFRLLFNITGLYYHFSLEVEE